MTPSTTYTVLSDPTDQPLPLSAVADRHGTVWQRGEDWSWWPTFPRSPRAVLDWHSLLVEHGPLTLLAPAASADHEERQTPRAGDDLVVALTQDMRDTNPTPQEWKDAAPLVPVLPWADALVARGWRHGSPARITTEVATALAQLARAYVDGGPRPDVHRRVLDRHRQEWPTGWRALDRLLRAIGAQS